MENTDKDQDVKANEPQSEKMFTQSQLNAIVANRLSEEREHYKDYDEIKAKAERLDELEDAQKSELVKAQEKADGLQKQLDALKAQTARDKMREGIAKKKGVPIELLTGETEEECEAQADAVLAFAKPRYPDVKDAGEPHKPTPPKKTRDQFADWFNAALQK